MSRRRDNYKHRESYVRLKWPVRVYTPRERKIDEELYSMIYSSPPIDCQINVDSSALGSVKYEQVVQRAWEYGWLYSLMLKINVDKGPKRKSLAPLFDLIGQYSREVSTTLFIVCDETTVFDSDELRGLEGMMKKQGKRYGLCLEVGKVALTQIMSIIPKGIERIALSNCNVTGLFDKLVSFVQPRPSLDALYLPAEAFTMAQYNIILSEAPNPEFKLILVHPTYQADDEESRSMVLDKQVVDEELDTAIAASRRQTEEHRKATINRRIDQLRAEVEKLKLML